MSTNIKFHDEEEARAALRDVRDDASATNWVAYTYDDANILSVAGMGEGDSAEMAGAFGPTDRGYGMVRVVDYVDGHRTVKFVFVTWAGERVSVMKKARMATHKGSITSFIEQCHVSIDASSAEDLSMDAVMQRVMDASGSANRVQPSAGGSAAPAPAESSGGGNAGAPQPAATSSYRSASASSAGGGCVVASNRGTSTKKPAVARQSQGLQIPTDAGLHEALKAVRADGDPTNWALFGYEGSSDVLTLVGTGTELDELRGHLQDDGVFYGLYRTTDVYDGHTTVKFVFILWIGERLKIMRKARISTHKGAITDFIGQYHCDVEATRIAEVTEEAITERVQFAAGTAHNVRAAPGGASSSKPAEQAAPVKKAMPKPSVAKKSQGLQIPEGAGLHEALKAVRADGDPTNWALFGYEGSSDVLTLVGTGTELDELRGHLQDDGVFYGLYRTTDVYDGHTTVKFVFILWIGERLKIMRKARISTHKGAITDFIGQYHCDVEATQLSELTYDEIYRKVQFAAGTANHVKR